MPSSLCFSLAVVLLYPLTCLGVLLGGWAMAIGPLGVFGGHLLMDNLRPRDRTDYRHMAPGWANLPLYLHLPWTAVTVTLLLWQAQPTQDLGGIGAALSGLFGQWVLDAHRGFEPMQQAACAYVVGLMLSANHIVGHELVHRRSEPLAMTSGLWLLAANGDAQFAISHVYGHHMNVGTADDPATARRGEGVYRFALRSAIGQYTEAWRIERHRLERRGQGVIGLHNRLLRTVAMSVALLALAGGFAGAEGAAMWLVAMLTAKFLFEIVNYIQHYGLLREPGCRVEARHSWDSDHRWATRVFYGLARHAHHHARPVLPYWQLTPAEAGRDGLQMRYGYIGAMLIACLPPLWHRHMRPMLAQWDSQLATEGERRLAERADGARFNPTSRGARQ
jgi:fatty acid desaturase